MSMLNGLLGGGEPTAGRKWRVSVTAGRRGPAAANDERVLYFDTLRKAKAEFNRLAKKYPTAPVALETLRVYGNNLGSRVLRTVYSIDLAI